jgi:hypothetical protein
LNEVFEIVLNSKKFVKQSNEQTLPNEFFGGLSPFSSSHFLAYKQPTPRFRSRTDREVAAALSVFLDSTIMSVLQELLYTLSLPQESVARNAAEIMCNDVLFNCQRKIALASFLSFFLSFFETNRNSNRGVV